MESSHELDAPPWRRIDGTLMSVARAIRKSYDRALCDVGLTLPESSLLAFIADSEPQTQTRLAEQLGLGRAAMGGRVDRLEQMGMVERRPDASDRRVWLIHLTPAGSAAVTEINRIDRRLREELRRGISRQERQQLAVTLLRLQENIRAIDEGDR